MLPPVPRTLDWKRSADEAMFQVSFRTSSVTIQRAENDDGTTVTFFIQLLDKNGTVVEAFSDYDLDKEAYQRADAGYYVAMRDIYEMARRKALGAEKVMREILSELDDDIPF